MNVIRVELTDADIEAAVGIMRSGNLRQGPVVEAFEKRFAAKVGAKHAVACSSGTAALHLAYLSCINSGDEVLVPSLTFIATASMVVYCGGRPVFCEADPESWLIDLADAERRIRKTTKVIAPVHLFGNVCDITKIRDLAEKYGLYVVWDAAQAHGATRRGSGIGGLEDMTCYSFYPSKNMIVGEGGMVTTNRWEVAERMKLLRNHGQETRYRHSEVGLNYRMTDVEAAIGIEQLKRLDSMLAIRRLNAELLTDGLKDIPGIRTQATVGRGHAYNQYCITVDYREFGMNRDMLAAELKFLQDIRTSVHYPTGLHRQKAFTDLFGEQLLPVTDSICDNILALPVHHGIRDVDCTRIVNSIKACSTKE